MSIKQKINTLLVTLLSFWWGITPALAQRNPKVTQEVLDELNPLNPAISQGTAENMAELSTPAGIVNRLTLYLFPAAGMVLFVMIIWGGFEILVGASGKKSLDAGKQRITAAVIGFILLFCAYWFAQIIEIVFGIRVV